VPTYEYECENKKCGKLYEVFMAMSADRTGVKCPHCGSKKKKQQITGCAFSFKNPVGTDRYENDHDYRFRHKLPDAAALREKAKNKASGESGYVGRNPYKKFDDVNRPGAFGEVK
jgi:putative FmdB family regulatory protein